MLQTHQNLNTGSDYKIVFTNSISNNELYIYVISACNLVVYYLYVNY